MPLFICEFNQNTKKRKLEKKTLKHTKIKKYIYF